MFDYIVFDLDGTLIDTLEGLTVAVNKTMEQLNFKYNYSKEEVKTFIGRGAKRLLTLALKREFSEEEFKLFLHNYEAFQYVSKPFKNVIETLKILNAKNIPLIIYSNKPDEILQKLITASLKGINFLYIQGQDLNYPPKPDVTLLNKIIAKFNLFNKKGLYVGDSIVDIQTANNANMKCLILTYGYGKIEEMDKEENKTYIKDFKEILTYLWLIKKN